MTKGDQLIEKGADKLQRLAREAAAKGGSGAKVADLLAEDAAFLRKLKPSLIKARAKGQAPTDQPPGTGAPPAPPGPQLGSRPKPKQKKKRRSRGPNPFLVTGVALVAGIALAKFVDWRGHAHPRD
ncbi:MAG: hypothetical protein M3R70_05715 [Actinomycetota bacterium]|nr:hypothetical protein [Actinomycetota bacterium]